MLLTAPPGDCDGCTPSYLPPKFGATAAFSTLPFVATFTFATFFAYRRVYPLLQGTHSSRNDKKTLPLPATAPEPTTQTLVRRTAALTFSSTIALSAVLTELLLCEISNSFNPTARSFALQITVASLLGLLVVAIPLLGIHTVVAKASPRPKSDRLRFRLQWGLELVGYAAFLVGFWALGALLPQSTDAETSSSSLNLFQACLDRLGITGVTLMALLSGFASVSAIWQTFGPKAKLVAESDINRKQAGLEATVDMIAEKKAQLQNLERKMSSVPPQGFWSRTVGSFRGGGDEQEKQTLEMEVGGLETMAFSLESSLSILRTRRSDQERRTSHVGRA
jgi:The Golgi pH Regulator (GPHR) Family N-terminal